MPIVVERRERGSGPRRPETVETPVVRCGWCGQRVESARKGRMAREPGAGPWLRDGEFLHASCVGPYRRRAGGELEVKGLGTLLRELADFRGPRLV